MSKRKDVMEKHWTAIDGRKTRFFVAPAGGEGDGERPLRLPILFLHGLGCDGTVWEPTLRELSLKGLCCPSVAPDMPGYGHSDGPYKALGMEELADWAVRFLDHRGIERAHLVGNSMGCQVALALARRHPARVGAVVIQGPTTGAHVPLWRYVAGLLRDISHESIPYNWRLLGMYLHMGPRRYFATVGAMRRDDPFRHASEIKAPVLIVRGGRDAIVSERTAKQLTAVLPDAAYLPIDSAAHAIEFNNPAEFSRAMVGFLRWSEERLFSVRAGGAAGQPASIVRQRSQSTATTVANTK
jgi:pimeloyl-ACP methyl ester carboxylesterase